MNRKRSFAPVVDEHVQLLILGSLPGEFSLAHNQYYANPLNQFWRLISEVTKIDFSPLSYQARLNVLLANRIGLWDVVAEANRDGSLDSKIRDHAHNDLVSLVANLPNLKAIAFNGKTAARIGLKILHGLADRYQIAILPSSSPAYTLPYADKQHAWKNLRDWISN